MKLPDARVACVTEKAAKLSSLMIVIEKNSPRIAAANLTRRFTHRGVKKLRSFGWNLMVAGKVRMRILGAVASRFFALNPFHFVLA